MSLISSEISKDKKAILKKYKTELQKLLISQFLSFEFNYTEKINFSCGSGRFFMDLYSENHWFSISDVDLIIIDRKNNAVIEKFSTPGVSKDEYFNLIVTDKYSDIIRSENIDKLVQYIKNVVIPTGDNAYDHFVQSCN